MNPDPVLTGSGLFSEVGSGSGPNRSGFATLVGTKLIVFLYYEAVHDA
jgi:hypothetical protein